MYCSHCMLATVQASSNRKKGGRFESTLVSLAVILLLVVNFFLLRNWSGSMSASSSKETNGSPYEPTRPVAVLFGDSITQYGVHASESG